MQVYRVRGSIWQGGSHLHLGMFLGEFQHSDVKYKVGTHRGLPGDLRTTESHLFSSARVLCKALGERAS